MNTAVAQVGGSHDISVLLGEADHERLGLKTVVFLHGNAFAEPHRWVLTTAALQTVWRDGWVDAIAARVLTSPVTVFAGIGTRVCSLVESARQLHRKIPVGRAVYNVDPAQQGTSDFFRALGLPPEAYLRGGWCEFMHDLSQVVAENHSAELQEVSHVRSAAAGVADIDVAHLSGQLTALGLFEYGHIRARWLLSKSYYEPRHGNEPGLMADLLLAVELIERASGKQARIREDGLVDFEHEGRAMSSIIVVSGRGQASAIAIEAELSTNRYWRRHAPRPLYAIIAGMEGDLSAVAPPPDLAGTERADDLVGGRREIQFATLTMLRQNSGLAREVVS
jgi:hypothetical protein